MNAWQFVRLYLNPGSILAFKNRNPCKHFHLNAYTFGNFENSKRKFGLPQTNDVPAHNSERRTQQYQAL